MIQDALLAIWILAPQRQIETGITQELAECNVLQRIVNNALHFGWATLRLVSHPNRGDQYCLVIKGSDLSRLKTRNADVLASIPGSDFLASRWAAIVDAKRRAI